MTSHTTHRRGRTTHALALGAALLGSLAIGSQAHAQAADRAGPPRGERGRGMDPGQMMERRIALLTERLQLTERQQSQVREIFEQEREQMAALRPKSGGERQDGQNGARRQGPSEEARQQMRAIRERSEQQLERVLTERQLAEYRELREAQRKERGSRQGRRGERPARDGNDGREPSRGGQLATATI
jgi:Spy/CpxP family protein refolding chaperone